MDSSIGTAALCVRKLPHYRHDAFSSGLKRIGFQVVAEPAARPCENDCIVVWNRQPIFESAVKRYEAAGAAIIVAENGYIGADADGNHLFALALNYHNGPGVWPAGGPERWEALGIDLAPWREGPGSFILALAQRGIGPRGVAMPHAWPMDVEQRLRAARSLPVKIRMHPGRLPPRQALADALAGCHCAITWGSTAALKALAMGYPVVSEMPGWIGLSAASRMVAALNWDGREDMFKRLAWAQWTAVELTAGEPFKRLILLHRMR
jgi:hypothetical protein